MRWEAETALLEVMWLKPLVVSPRRKRLRSIPTSRLRRAVAERLVVLDPLGELCVRGVYVVVVSEHVHLVQVSPHDLKSREDVAR